MKTPEQLTKAQLVTLVTSIQHWFYVDYKYIADAKRADYWNPEKEVGGADTVEFVLEQLDNAGLRPDREEKFDPWTLDELTTIFTAAAQAGHAANVGEDGGTCNFDACTIRLPGLVPELVIEHAKSCDLCLTYRGKEKGARGFSEMWGERYFIGLFESTGQGNRRVRVAEAIDKVFNAAGVDTFMYCQVD